DDKGWDARKRAYCLKIQPATGSFARNLIYSTKPVRGYRRIFCWHISVRSKFIIKPEDVYSSSLKAGVHAKTDDL
ncbi:hypothetical protein JEJ81_16555, partial [Klebsiella pneumoniae]|uniref:hypothetical protein n=1 Tax=Klebsiella pneumoniae TaxID=573 RepID=UPI0021189BD2